ncbi:MAG: GNAT family N-acetyltransferase [Actinobacteria bacterium]|nr:GNAT family N-acetyltransferase [Actinomycetota bacterium]
MTLRPWHERDVPALVACANDPELARWLDTLPQPYTEQDARDYVAHGVRGWSGEAPETTFAVVDAATDEPLASCGIRWQEAEQGVAEIGYWTRREARGRGVATRAVRLLAGWVLGELAYERLQLRADTGNVASQRVAERAGFTREGVIRSARTHSRDGRRIDFALYSLLRQEL